MGKNIHIDWSIKNDADNISNGFLLRERNGCNFILCDLNLQNNLPILNLVFRPSKIEISPEDTLCFYLKDNILIELHGSKQTEYFKKKKCNIYRLSREVMELLKEMPIKSIVVKSRKEGSIDLISRVLGRRAFNIYVEIYNHILEVNNELINAIPKKLECSVVSKISVEPISPVTTVKFVPQNEEYYVYLMCDLSNGYYKIDISKTLECSEKSFYSEKPNTELLFAQKFPSRKMASAFAAALCRTYKEKSIGNEWLILTRNDIFEIEKVLPIKFTPKSEKTDESEECFVYLMHDLSNDHYKIGISKKPQYREKTLQSEKPSVELLFAKRFPSRKIARNVEYTLHETYKNKQIRGEWFILTNEDILELEKVLNT